MPCRWVTIRGKRVRLSGPVGPPTIVTEIASITAMLIVASLAAVAVFHSPRITPEEAKDASLRIWLDDEKGYFAEARLRPGAPPIYTALTAEQAQRLKGPEPDPSLIALAFELKEPVDA